MCLRFLLLQHTVLRISNCITLTLLLFRGEKLSPVYSLWRRPPDIFLVLLYQSKYSTLSTKNERIATYLHHMISSMHLGQHLTGNCCLSLPCLSATKLKTFRPADHRREGPCDVPALCISGLTEYFHLL